MSPLTMSSNNSQHVGLKNVFGPQRQKFMQLVAAKLHEEQPWYHGSINRDAAEKRISQSGHMDGKFLLVLFCLLCLAEVIAKIVDFFFLLNNSLLKTIKLKKNEFIDDTWKYLATLTICNWFCNKL